MLSETVKDMASRIGEFYLQKHSKDYDKACEELERLQITDIDVGDAVTIKLCRPGMLIGKRGQNVTELEAFLGKKVVIREEMEHLYHYLLPFDEEAYSEALERDYDPRDYPPGHEARSDYY